MSNIDENEILVANLAGQVARSMVDTARSSIDNSHLNRSNKINPHQFINNYRSATGRQPAPPNAGQPVYPQYRHPNYVDPYQQPPGYTNQPQPVVFPGQPQGQHYGSEIPSSLPSNVPQLFIPPTIDGKPIQEIQQIVQPEQTNTFDMSNTQGFNVPVYNNGTTSSIDTQEIKDQIASIKDELKLLRRAVNALTNQLRKEKKEKPEVQEQPSTNTEIDENSDKK